MHAHRRGLVSEEALGAGWGLVGITCIKIWLGLVRLVAASPGSYAPLKIITTNLSS